MDKNKSQADDYTHFGFESVKTAEKAQHVGRVFSAVASKYDLMNDVMSLGIHRLWKRMTVFTGQFRTGQKVLDLAGGTGDLAALIGPRLGPEGELVLADINEQMLHQGRDRLLDQGMSQVKYVLANAEVLPFPAEYFHAVTMAFGLRNVTDKNRALREIHRILKPGGQVLILEFSQVKQPWLQKIYDVYSFKILPKLGQWIASDEKSYRYLAESIRMHPDQEQLKLMLQQAGFERVDYFNFSAGVVALHRGYKT